MKQLAVRCFFVGLAFYLNFLLCTVGLAATNICGDRVREGWEECDNGEFNSDSLPDACRTDCRRAFCGDGVTDAGEQCDSHYNRNSNEIPNACRTDCRSAHCGDGVLDDGEQCDDKNSDAYDGCHQCQSCIPVKDDLVLSNSDAKVVLCPGVYELEDKGREGIIIVDGYGMKIEAEGVELKGKPMSFAQPANSSKAAANLKNIAKSVMSKRGAAKKDKAGTQEVIPSGDQGTGTGPQFGGGMATQPLQGTAIVIEADEVTLQNCKVTKFRNGVKLQSRGAALVNNIVCGNSHDIISAQSGNFGAKNRCANVQGWQENCAGGCTLNCE